MRKFPYSWEEAQKRQHLYHSRYTVWLVNPAGERHYLNYISRKSGRGLQTILHNRVNNPEGRAELEQVMGVNMGSLNYTKKAGQLLLTNGWKVVFGGTIMQEAMDHKWRMSMIDGTS